MFSGFQDRWTLARQIKLIYHSNMNCQAPVSLNFIGLRENNLVNDCFIEVFKGVKELIVSDISFSLRFFVENKKVYVKL